jgi:hypothetical protein
MRESHVGEPGQRIDLIELCRHDQRGHGRRRLAPRLKRPTSVVCQAALLFSRTIFLTRHDARSDGIETTAARRNVAPIFQTTCIGFPAQEFIVELSDTSREKLLTVRHVPTASEGHLDPSGAPFTHATETKISL